LVRKVYLDVDDAKKSMTSMSDRSLRGWHKLRELLKKRIRQNAPDITFRIQPIPEKKLKGSPP